MITHKVEGGFGETSDIIIVSIIRDASNISVSLSDVVVGRGISCVCDWLDITLVIQHADSGAGAASFCGVCVPFDAESMRGVSEVSSISVVFR